MDEHTAERCLEPFFSTKPEGSGTGLGLFAVQAIVTQAGGGMRVDSSPGHGTMFTMWFPSLGEVTEPSAPS
jgi:signal transduction histidine kinase